MEEAKGGKGRGQGEEFGPAGIDEMAVEDSYKVEVLAVR